MNRFVQSDALYGMERPPPVLLDRVGETVRTDDDQDRLSRQCSGSGKVIKEERAVEGLDGNVM
jgi:hypothetical protein